jgi:hypothetical protein
MSNWLERVLFKLGQGMVFRSPGGPVRGARCALVPRTWAELEDWASTSGPMRIDFYDDAQSGPEVEEFWDRPLQYRRAREPLDHRDFVSSWTMRQGSRFAVSRRFRK